MKNAAPSTSRSKSFVIPNACNSQATQALKPLYRWAGGKRKLLNDYKAIIPELAGFNSYIEPFFGGGAFFCDVVNRTNINNLFINDLNKELIAVYRAMQEEPIRFIAKCETLASIWNNLAVEKRKAWYYELRGIYQQLEVGNVESASYLYVLMLLCYNGIWETSKKLNRFNTAAGTVERKLVINPDLILAWSNQLQNTNISSVSYEEIDIPKSPSLIFCDPPYRAISGANAVKYGSHFDDKDQKKLLEWCHKRSQEGHTVLLSNADLKDGFFESQLPSNAQIHYIDIEYTVGRRSTDKTAKPKSVEVLIIFYPIEMKQEVSRDAANDEIYGQSNRTFRSNAKFKESNKNTANFIANRSTNLCLCAVHNEAKVNPYKRNLKHAIWPMGP
jgi:DNA adenine methylase